MNILFRIVAATCALLFFHAGMAQEGAVKREGSKNCFSGDGLFKESLSRGYRVGAEATAGGQEYSGAQVYYMYALSRKERTWGVIASFYYEGSPTQCVLIGGVNWTPIEMKHDVSRTLDQDPIRKTTKKCAPVGHLLAQLEEIGEVPVGRGNVMPGIDEILTLSDDGSWTSVQVQQTGEGEAGCINSWGSGMRLRSSFLPVAKAE